MSGRRHLLTPGQLSIGDSALFWGPGGWGSPPLTALPHSGRERYQHGSPCKLEELSLAPRDDAVFSRAAAAFSVLMTIARLAQALPPEPHSPLKCTSSQWSAGFDLAGSATPGHIHSVGERCNFLGQHLRF